MTNELDVGRRLFSVPVLLQDWHQVGEGGHNNNNGGGGGEGEEGAARYWELFVDLLMVAGASAISEEWEHDPTAEGFSRFALYYLIVVQGWIIYNHHYMSRFDDHSLTHFVVLFFYLLGTAGTIVNLGLEISNFVRSLMLQRFALLVMFLVPGVALPRTRAFSGYFCGYLGVSIVVYGFAMVSPKALWFGVLVDFLLEPTMGMFGDSSNMIPVKIDHDKDRLGVLVLIMLGETVITSTLQYRSYMLEGSHSSEDLDNDDHDDERMLTEYETNGNPAVDAYYTVLIWSFLLIFMYALLYFSIQPSAEMHALRRSKFTGVVMLVSSKLLGISLLSVGVCINLIVKGVLEQKDENNQFCIQILGASVGSALVILGVQRLCHYWGRYPSPEDSNWIRIVCWLWWIEYLIGSLSPFILTLPPVVEVIGIDSSTSLVQSLAMISLLLLFMTVVETSFSHVLINKTNSVRGRGSEPLLLSHPTTSSGTTFVVLNIDGQEGHTNNKSYGALD